MRRNSKATSFPLTCDDSVANEEEKSFHSQRLRHSQSAKTDKSESIRAGSSLLSGQPTTTTMKESDEWDEKAAQVKTKLISVWNNMKYGWTARMSNTTFNKENPIYLLGKCYYESKLTVERNEHKDAPSVFDHFQQDFTSRIWFTYRQEFPMLPGSNLTTDCGWGCMLRSAQMLLAQALVVHFLTRDWNVYKSQSKATMMIHRQIIRWFADSPDKQHPFSIHRLARIGETMGKKPGDWYGPVSAAYILKAAMDSAVEFALHPTLSQICLYVAQDGTVYKEDILRLCSQSNTSTATEEARTTVDEMINQSELDDGQFIEMDDPNAFHEFSAKSLLFPSLYDYVEVPNAYSDVTNCAQTEKHVHCWPLNDPESLESVDTEDIISEHSPNISGPTSPTTVSGQSTDMLNDQQSGMHKLGQFAQTCCENSNAAVTNWYSEGTKSKSSYHVKSGSDTVSASLMTTSAVEKDRHRQTSTCSSSLHALPKNLDCADKGTRENKMSFKFDFKSADHTCRSVVADDGNPNKSTTIRSNALSEIRVENDSSVSKATCDSFVSGRSTESNRNVLYKNTSNTNSLNAKKNNSFLDRVSKSFVFALEQFSDTTTTKKSCGAVPKQTAALRDENVELAGVAGEFSNGRETRCQVHLASEDLTKNHHSSSEHCSDKQNTVQEENNVSSNNQRVCYTNMMPSTCSSSNESWKALVLLVPMRLGGECLNELYKPCIKKVLNEKCCLGIIGGRPKHSLYFIGWQGDKLIFLDPHYCQDSINCESNDFKIETFHCMTPRKMSFTKMDPSCTIGFYFRTKQEYDDFVCRAPELLRPTQTGRDYPLFIFVDGSSSQHEGDDLATTKEDRFLHILHKDKNGRILHAPEEFVFL